MPPGPMDAVALRNTSSTSKPSIAGVHLWESGE
jgi:hypothetical protein